MLPFSSSVDVILAVIVVSTLVGLSLFVFLLARVQRPAMRELTFTLLEGEALALEGAPATDRAKHSGAVTHA